MNRESKIPGTKGVYIKLKINNKNYYSYKIIDEKYIDANNNYFEVTDKQIINYSYQYISKPSECYDDKIRSLGLKGHFQCTLYYCVNYNKTIENDSLQISDCNFSGIVKE
jgi:hypothetical protein